MTPVSAKLAPAVPATATGADGTALSRGAQTRVRGHFYQDVDFYKEAVADLPEGDPAREAKTVADLRALVATPETPPRPAWHDITPGRAAALLVCGAGLMGGAFLGPTSALVVAGAVGGAALGAGALTFAGRARAWWSVRYLARDYSKHSSPGAFREWIASGHPFKNKVLLRVLLDGKTSDDVRQIAVAALRGTTDPAVLTVITEQLQKGNGMTRVYAAEVLAGTDDPEARKALVFALDDTVNQVRRAAAEALAQTSGPDVIAALVGAVGDKDNEVQEIAIAFVARELGSAAVPLLLKRINKDTYRQVCIAAIKALTDTGADRTEPGILTVLLDRIQNDERGEVRKAAVEALPDTNDPRVATALLTSLQRYGGEATAKRLRGTADPDHIRVLRLLLVEEQPHCRYCAAVALKGTSDPDIRAKLEAMATDDPDKDIRRVAREALLPV